MPEPNDVISGIVGATAAIAATLPHPGDPVVVAFAGVIGGFLGGLLAMARGETLEERRDDIAMGAWYGTGFGLAVYGFGLITGLY